MFITNLTQAIIQSLLEAKDELNYSKLFHNVRERLKLSRNGKRWQLANRDFDCEISMLLNEELLGRRTDEASKKKIKPVHFSLTKKALKQHHFDVLGISPEKERRRKLYHTLFFYQTFSPIRGISKNQLDEILSRYGKDLVVESYCHSTGTNFTQTINEPIEYLQFLKTELINTVSSKHETTVRYSYRSLSFSEEEIKEYLKKPV